MIISSFLQKFPVEDVSVSGNDDKNMRKNSLIYSSNVFRQYVLGTEIGEPHNLISFYHFSLRLMAGVSNDSKPAIKAILFIYIFFSLSSVFSSCVFACRSKVCANPWRELITIITRRLKLLPVSRCYMYKNKLSKTSLCSLTSPVLLAQSVRACRTNWHSRMILFWMKQWQDVLITTQHEKWFASKK